IVRQQPIPDEGDTQERENLWPDEVTPSHQRDANEQRNRPGESHGGAGESTLRDQSECGEPDEQLQDKESRRTEAAGCSREQALGEDLVIDPRMIRGSIGISVRCRKLVGSKDRTPEENVSPKIVVRNGGR